LLAGGAGTFRNICARILEVLGGHRQNMTAARLASHCEQLRVLICGAKPVPLGAAIHVYWFEPPCSSSLSPHTRLFRAPVLWSRRLWTTAGGTVEYTGVTVGLRVRPVCWRALSRSSTLGGCSPLAGMGYATTCEA
jgi:hypothetical protein